MSLSAAALLALLLAACAAGPGAGTAPAPPDGEPVPLRFAWPLGTVARVEVSRQVRRREGDAERRYAVGGRYRMRVEPAGAGLRVVTDEFRVDRLNDRMLTEAAAAEAAIFARDRSPLLTLLAPTLLVDSRATVVRVEGLGAIRDFWRSAIPDAERDDPAGRRLWNLIFGDLVSERAYAARVSMTWDMLVGTWAGADLQPGAELVAAEGGYYQAGPGVRVPVEMAFQLVEFASCRSPAGACVRLQLRHSPDPDVMAQAFESLVRVVVPDATGESWVETYELETEVDVVTEPETLLPHRAEIRERSRLVMRDGDRVAARYEKRVETRYRYRYEGR